MAAAGSNNQSKTSSRQKSAKSLHKYAPKRAAIKLRASTCIAKRTRDKSPKASCSVKRSKAGSPPVNPRGTSGKLKSPPASKGSDTTSARNAASKGLSGKIKVRARPSIAGRHRKGTSSDIIDLWAFASIGKREASLNASMKVNIIYERHCSKPAKVSPQKIETATQLQEPKAEDNSAGKTNKKLKIREKTNKANSKKLLTKSLKSCEGGGSSSSSSSDTDCQDVLEDQKLLSKQKTKMDIISGCKIGSSKKRKSPGYQIFCNEPPAKCKNVNKKLPIKSKTRVRKYKKKATPSGHQLCNIIEKCPRQASLVAKAMIAMEQEEDTVGDLSARTQVYDWMELRSVMHTERRRVRWYSGLGSCLKGTKVKPLDSQQPGREDDWSDVEQPEESQVLVEGSDLLHGALLRTLHQMGDTRLLKEYLRAQKQDFPGQVDVEVCSTPDMPRPRTPDLNKHKNLTAPKVVERSEEEAETFEKPVMTSPVKEQLYRVATPTPVFPPSPRPSMHHPVAQPICLPQHSHPHPQPIKVTPYVPSAAYICQYAVDRHQGGGLYVPPSPSPMAFGVAGNEVAHREYSSSFTFSHIGSLSMARRPVNPFPSTSYSQSLHVPMPHVGFNYAAAYYPQQTFPLHHQPYPSLIQAAVLPHQLPQAAVLPHQLPQDVSQLETYPPDFPAYHPVLSASMAPEVSPVASTHRPTPMMPARPTHRPTPMMTALPTQRPTPMMPPPPSLRQPILPHHGLTSIPSMESLRSLNTLTGQPLVPSPASDFATSLLQPPHQQPGPCPAAGPHYPLGRDHPGSSSSKFSLACHSRNKSFSPCKKENEDILPYDCHVVNQSSMCNSEVMPRSLNTSRTSSESSNVSDLLHSAHTTMYQTDGLNAIDSFRDYHQMQAVSDSAVGNYSPSRTGQPTFSNSYSVSSILDMPTCKVKSEPEQKVWPALQLFPLPFSRHYHQREQPECVRSSAGSETSLPQAVHSEPDAMLQNNMSNSTQSVNLSSSTQSFNVSSRTQSVNVSSSTPSVNVSSSTQSVNVSSSTQSVNVSSSTQSVKEERELSASSAGHIIVIDDTDDDTDNDTDRGVDLDADESSDDEPLARLIKPKPTDEVVSHTTDRQTDEVISLATDRQTDEVVSQATDRQTQDIPSKVTAAVKVKSKPALLSPHRLSNKGRSHQKSTERGVEQTGPSGIQTSQAAHKREGQTVSKKWAGRHQLSGEGKTTTGGDGRPQAETRNRPASRKGSSALVCKAAKKATRKMHIPPPWPLVPARVNTNHGWHWIEEGQMKPIPKLTQGKEEPVRIRKCYQSMKHTSGEIVSVRDCVILQSDGDGQIPFVARVSALWENLNGEMMFSMLWYYQPEHTAVGRQSDDGEQELFASKHREENSVACIDDKCFVLMFNEYCRLEAEAVRSEQGVSLPRWRQLMPQVSASDRDVCRPVPGPNTCADNIWFCRYDYDVRKKLVKKPKYKKSNLRYRAPI